MNKIKLDLWKIINLDIQKKFNRDKIKNSVAKLKNYNYYKVLTNDKNNYYNQ